MADDNIHFDLAISPSATSALQAIASERQMTLSDVVQRAMALMFEADKARKRGQSLGVLDADKKPVAELVGY